MPLWRDDFSTLSLEEVVKYQLENRAWNKELRNLTTALVNRRLANEISQDDYLTNRKIALENSVECQRRAAVLDSQIARCTVRPLLRAN